MLVRLSVTFVVFFFIYKDDLIWIISVMRTVNGWLVLTRNASICLEPNVNAITSTYMMALSFDYVLICESIMFVLGCTVVYSMRVPRTRYKAATLHAVNIHGIVLLKMYYLSIKHVLSNEFLTLLCKATFLRPRGIFLFVYYLSRVHIHILKLFQHNTQEHMEHFTWFWNFIPLT